jgi:hypothetical protein
VGFDFNYKDSTGWIERVGFRSPCEEHEATREEVLLWNRIQELEKELDNRCPPEVLDLINRIPTEAIQIALYPEDFAAIRQYAWHRIKMVVDSALNRRGILGCLSLMDDGSPSAVHVSVDRKLAPKTVLVVS